LCERFLNVRVRLEEDLDHRYAVQRSRFDVLDIVDRRRQAALVVEHDAFFHLVGRQTLEGPDDR